MKQTWTNFIYSFRSKLLFSIKTLQESIVSRTVLAKRHKIKKLKNKESVFTMQK